MEFLNIVYIILITVGISAQNVIKKYYNSRFGDHDVFVFNAFAVLAACLFFVFRSGFRLSFDVKLLPYVFGFAAAYCVSVVFVFFAIQYGPLSLTSLVQSYSLIIPTFYGLMFDDDKADMFFCIGLCFLAASLLLINARKKESGITIKWAIYAVLAFAGSGICSTVQTVQQQVFNQGYQNEFMIAAFFCVTVVLFTFAIVRERRVFFDSVKKGIAPMVLCGIANGGVNLLVMLVSSQVNKSLMFPLISAGGIVLTWIIAVFLYKEKLTFKQNIGLILGVVSIIFLNI